MSNTRRTELLRDQAVLGASITPAVARRLGNSPQMVLGTYAHLWRDDDDRTRDAIDAVLAWAGTDGP